MQQTDTGSWERRVEEAHAYFGRFTREAGLEDAIEESIARGERRGPRAVNVLVHPEFAWHPQTELQENVLPQDAREVSDATERYAQRIAALLAADPGTIVISYNGAREDDGRFRYDDAAAILTPPVGPRRSLQGMLGSAGMRTLLSRLDGIREDDAIRIHGAAWNRCPKTFARQLIGIATFGHYMPPYCREDPVGMLTALHTETYMSLLHHADRIRTHIGFRLGIQHNSQNVRTPDSLCADLAEPGITSVYPEKPVAPKRLATVC